MSRILVTRINYAPENIGTGKYTAELCEWPAAPAAPQDANKQK